MEGNNLVEKGEGINRVIRHRWGLGKCDVMRAQEGFSNERINYHKLQPWILCFMK